MLSPYDLYNLGYTRTTMVNTKSDAKKKF